MTRCEVCGWTRLEADALCTVFLWDPIKHLLLAGERVFLCDRMLS